MNKSISQRCSVCESAKKILTSKFSYTRFFPTPRIKLKLGLQIGGRLLIPTHLDQSKYVANQQQVSGFAVLFDRPQQTVQECFYFPSNQQQQQVSVRLYCAFDWLRHSVQEGFHFPSCNSKIPVFLFELFHLCTLKTS
jgi:hypothetical protein